MNLNVGDSITIKPDMFMCNTQFNGKTATIRRIRVNWENKKVYYLDFNTPVEMEYSPSGEECYFTEDCFTITMEGMS